MGKILGTCLLGFALLVTVTAADDAAVTEAEKAARAWLAEVDAGQYEASWDHAAELFRAAVMKGVWKQQLEAARAPLGAVERRTLRSTQFTRELPGAPDGEYVVIQYETSFANKASAVETITPMRDPDGTWRVSGYYIR